MVAKLVQRRSRDRDAAAVAAVTVTATATATAVLRNVSFGDVVLCLGQSNIWLPMSYDIDRHRTYASLAAGAYGHVRLFNHGFATPDTVPVAAKASPVWAGGSSGAMGGGMWQRATNETVRAFGAVCWYTGVALAPGGGGVRRTHRPHCSCTTTS